jgi:hypothetical protein
MTVAEVAREIGCSLRTVKRVTASRAKREERRTRWPGGSRWPSARRSASACGEATPSQPSPSSWVGRPRRCPGRCTPTQGAKATGPGEPTTGLTTGEAAKGGEARRPRAGRTGDGVAPAVVVAGGDRPALAHGVPRRSDDAGVARDHLPEHLCAGTRWAEPRAGSLSADRQGPTPAPSPHGDARPHP